MQKLSIKPSRLNGAISVPPSKSQTMRAIIFALMAQGVSRIQNPLCSPDTEAMLCAVEQLGAKISRQEDLIEIRGVDGVLQPPDDVIDAQNSGLVLRFIGALAAHLPRYTVITGDHSIRYNRPVQPLLEALEQLGACAISTKLDGFAPIIIRGPMRPGYVKMCGRDSQPVSALLIAASFLQGTTEIEVSDPGERPWIDLTLSWLDRFQISYERRGYTHYHLSGGASLSGFSYTVPADFSTATYPVAAALVTGSEITLDNLHFEDPQGDKQVIAMLQKLGAKIEVTKSSLRVMKSKLNGARLDVNDVIDALPLFATLACFAESPTEIVGGKIARMKESNRISAIAAELKKMGAKVEEREDGLLVYPSQLAGAQLFSHHDHRIALSLLVAALGAKGESTIEGYTCIAKSYPTFFQDFQKLGGGLE
ncbi:MAG: 3-phosphoshikimate 1-carboxyvinyltransferase [Chlamydiales bacterium]